MYLIEVPVEGGGRLLVQVVAKGSSEMHFAVALAGKRPESAADGD